MGISQLQFRLRRNSHLLRNSESANYVPRGELSLAPGIVPRAGRHREPLRARVAHGRTGPHPQTRSAGISPQEFKKRKAARGVSGGSEKIRLGSVEVESFRCRL